MRHRSRQQRDWSTVEDDGWIVDSGQTRSSSGTIGCASCNAIKDNKRAQAHSDRCRTRIEECLRTTPHGAEKLNRRNEGWPKRYGEEDRGRREVTKPQQQCQKQNQQYQNREKIRLNQKRMLYFSAIRAFFGPFQ